MAGTGNQDGPAASPIRLKRLAAELRMRRRRLDAYRTSPPWPGKDPALRFERAHYDHRLLLAAVMLEVPYSEPTDLPLPAESRVLLEDRLALAGLDVMATMSEGTGNVLQDGDLSL